MKIQSAKDLLVYRRAFELAVKVFGETRKWPAEERYALISQVRRSSRAVCANLREAWAKRRFPAHFSSKLTDCDGECAETDTWLDLALACGVCGAEEHRLLTSQNREVGRMLGSMILNPEPFLLLIPKAWEEREILRNRKTRLPPPDPEP